MSDKLMSEGLKHRDIGSPDRSSRTGDRLRNAREKKGWSVQETAEMLHIIPRYVKAIESSEFTKLPGLVFLKGYVRAYGQLVDLPENQLLEDLEKDLAQSDNLFVSPVPGTGGPITIAEPKPKPSPWLMLSLLILIGAGFFVWTSLDSSENVQPSSTEVESGTATTLAEASAKQPTDKTTDNNLMYQADADAGAMKLNSSAPLEAILNEETTPNEEATPDKNVAGTLSSAVISADAVAPGMAESNFEDGTELLPLPEAPADDIPADQSMYTVLSESYADLKDVEDVEDVEDVVAAQDTDAGLVKVKVRFNGDCWFDVRDQENNRVVGLYRSGDNVDFSGRYPLTFVVGAVDAAVISVNSKTVDFADYTVKKNRAQFTLEQ